MKHKFTVAIEHANGEMFSLSRWCKNALKLQDMEAWKRENPNEFKTNVQAWLKGQLIVTIENLDVVVKEAA